MKTALAMTFVASIFVAGIALAQTTPQGTGSVESPGNSAVKDPAPKPAAAPVEGANSFTESQARSRIEAQGFSSVTGLTKGDDGVWRGKAAKGGSTVEVAVDFKGDVTSK